MPALANPSADPHASRSSHAYDSQWLFTEDELLLAPSILAGMGASEERQGRAKGVNFILQVGILLKLPQITLSTASVFLHRFYMRYSMKEDPTGRKQFFHYYPVAAACLWLAAKVEENCRKMKELVIACVRIAQKDPDKVVDEQDKEFWRWRDNILTLEDKLLEGLCFDLSLEPPYYHLYEFMKSIGVAENKAFRNAAWAWINDSVMTPICLLFPARVIAAASIYAAARSQDVDFEFPEDPNGRGGWWRALGVELRDVKRACNFMADVYENAPTRTGAAEGMYLRTPEDDDDRGMGRDTTREESLASAAGSEVSRKRTRAEVDRNGDGHGADNMQWGGDDESDAKRQRPAGSSDVQGGALAGNEESGEPEEVTTNGVHANGGGSISGVPPEAGPVVKDGVTDDKRPVNPDPEGSEEGELDE